MNIKKFQDKDFEEVKNIIAKFRVALAKLNGIDKKENLKAARKELNKYRKKDYPIYIAEINSKIVGYLVCRVEDDVVWAESLYVLPDYRRKGIGSSLYKKAEKIVEGLGSDTLYNWIHPNNDKIINFLKKQGYDVLNLIEVRKKRKNENLNSKMNVNEHEFNY
ncbi:MAG: N-acetyltransferase family protein [Nanoarchaeota archaeon]